jgi:hypothetical protein
MKAFDVIIPYLRQSLTDPGKIIHINDHVRVPIKQDAFRPLNRSTGRVIFIDGGNGDILRAPNVSVQFARLCAIVYEEKKRTMRETKEFFIVVTAMKENLDLMYEAKLIDAEGKLISDPIKINSLDPSLKSGQHRITPDIVANHVRKLEEVRFTRTLVNNLNKGDLIVRDGDLLSSGPFIENELKNLRIACQNKEVDIVGLSKTSRLCTDSGASALSIIHSLAPKGCWYYFIDGQVGFTKLNANSKYVFRFDIFNRENIEKNLSLLLPLSADPVFLGYPYGLIDVDKSARVTDFELRQLRLRFSLKSNGLFESLESGVDAHDILNTL